MIKKSGGGDFLVLRAAGTDAYNRLIYDLGGLNSVATLILHTRRAASDPFVIDTIRRAAAIFIAGGQQSRYVALWQGTPVEEAIQHVVSKGAPVGGTSAGLAILGEFFYSARNGSISSAAALADPFDRRVTVDRDFLRLPALAGVLTDSHFSQRDRLGRLVTFLARLLADGQSEEAKGIGIDAATALLVEADGATTLQGRGAAYFLYRAGQPEICEPNTPLTFLDVSVYEVSEDASFDLATWMGYGGRGYTISAEKGVLICPPSMKSTVCAANHPLTAVRTFTDQLR